MSSITYPLTVLVAWFLVATSLRAQDVVPSIDPVATLTTSDNESQELRPGESYSGSAPLTVHFQANPSNVGNYSAYYEWRFYTESDPQNPYLIRYDENTDYTFTSAGSHRIVCYATYVQGTDTVAYTADYWAEMGAIAISISESKLDFPNAFSPNGDGINDIYKAKSGYQSIVEFHAYIFNRWGTKLYEWTDPAGGWDGKYRGKDVAQGVYFCQVKAKGADGRVFNIRKDVNLLRDYTEGTTVSQ